MLGRSQLRASAQVRTTQWEFIESSPKVDRGSDDVVRSSPRAHQRFARKFVESSPTSCQELAKSLSEEYWEFVGSSPEEIGSSSGVYKYPTHYCFRKQE
ncbi:hypothetical protein BHE74_00034921 [Ensete ventricosum]|nr:hypothetical protein BHE74_00034921 [Ensete ventricosum]